MSIKPPFTAVEVRRAASGFYEGHSVEIARVEQGHYGCACDLGLGLAGQCQ